MRYPVNRNTPITGDIQFHLNNEAGYAIDFGSQLGDELFAVVSGSVERFYTWWGGSDTLILHGDNGVFYLYAHCLDTVRTGRVNEGDVIAHAGNDGNSTGPHLHFGASTDYNRLKAYSTSVEDNYLNEVLNGSNSSNNSTGGRSSCLVEFKNSFRYYDAEGKQVGVTAPGFFGEISKCEFFENWYTVEFTFGTFYMKSEAINDEDVSQASENRNAQLVKFTGDVGVLGINDGWYAKIYKAQFHENQYVIELKYGVFTIDSSIINGNLCQSA